MLSYRDFAKYFGRYLVDDEFQSFLTANFDDLTDYNIFNGYIVSNNTGIELGFKNDEAVYDDDEEVIFEKGRPIFSHINFHPGSAIMVSYFPFGIDFSFIRSAVLAKAGDPTQSKTGYIQTLKLHFLNDSYKSGNIAITIEYDTSEETVKLIQLRDNELAGDHLRL